MTSSLAELLGLGDRELVAIVGAGGKSMLLLRLGAELVADGKRVISTTTTRLGSEQLIGTVCLTAEPAAVESRFTSPGPVFVVSSDDGRKVIGISPEAVDRLFAETSADYLVAEADGARRRLIKAPADHEPVIPSAATVVVVVASLDAIGRPVAEAAHRPEAVSALTGLSLTDLIEADHFAVLMAHPNGGLKRVPNQARVVVALTGGNPGERGEAAGLIGRQLDSESRIEGTVLIPALNRASYS